MSHLDPHDLVGSIRELWWSELTVDVPLKVEAIDFHRAPVLDKGKGNYIVYYCLVSENYTELDLVKGDELYLYISLNSYIIALKRLSSRFRQDTQSHISKGKNLYFEFCPINSRYMRIFTQEVRDPTSVQLDNSQHHYSLILEDNNWREDKNE